MSDAPDMRPGTPPRDRSDLILGRLTLLQAGFILAAIWLAFTALATFWVGWSHNQEGSAIGKLGALGDSYAIINSFFGLFGIVALAHGIIDRNSERRDQEQAERSRRTHEAKLTALSALLQAQVAAYGESTHRQDRLRMEMYFLEDRKALAPAEIQVQLEKCLALHESLVLNCRNYDRNIMTLMGALAAMVGYEGGVTMQRAPEYDMPEPPRPGAGGPGPRFVVEN